jgi:DNA-binding NarL/FixJ family response regulator
MDAAERREILDRYADHTRRFDELASRRKDGNAEVIPFTAPLRELEQEPTMREIEVLQLISDGLVNLLAKLQARSRAHAVAVGFRRGIIG